MEEAKQGETDFMRLSATALLQRSDSDEHMLIHPDVV